MKIKTIDIRCKKWFDKPNGNTYFSCKVILNYGMKNEKTYYIPFQYGYGSQFENEVMKTIDPTWKGTLRSYCYIWSIILRVLEEPSTKKVAKNLDY